MPQIAEFERWNNPYDSPAIVADEAAMDFRTEAPVDELRAFVGPKADHFLRKWAPRLMSPDGEVKMSWIAFFFPNLWMAYRKMYLAALAVVGVDFVSAVVSGILFLPNNGQYLAVSAIARLMLCIVCAAWANSWYLNHAMRAISTARAEGFEHEQLLHVLSNRGGTNAWAVGGMIFLSMVIGMATQLILLVWLAISVGR